MSKKHINIFSVLLSTMILLTFFYFISLNAQSNNKDTGRYQAVASYRQQGDWVFITVIDTQTGEVVKKEMYSGFNSKNIDKEK